MYGQFLLIERSCSDVEKRPSCLCPKIGTESAEENVKSTTWTDQEFEELVEGLRQGDPSAMSSIWREFNPSLIRFLRSLGTSEPDDVAQETWVSFAKAAKDFKGSQNNLKALLFHIARRRLADHLRSRYRRVQTVGIDDKAHLFSSEDHDRVDEADDLEKALRLLALLPEAQSEVVALRVIGGFDTKIVAELVGRSEGSVRVLTHRGLSKLAEVLDASKKNSRSIDSASVVKEGR